MSIKARWTLRIASFILLGFVLGNLLFLNYIILKRSVVDTSLVATVASVDETEDYCDNEDCVTKIYEAIAESTQSAIYSTNESTGEDQSVESFISLGSGINRSTEWEDIPGVQVTIDDTNYPDIQEVLFEAGILIPTGNQTVYVRLFNQTAKHPVWFSDLSHSGGDPTVLMSENIFLDEGQNTYQVQMKSSLGFATQLIESRIRIVTK